jgi:hypothetical protein
MKNNLLILLLCKNPGNHLIELNNFFRDNDLLSVIINENPELPNTYCGLNRIKKGSTAWETSFYYIENDITKYDYAWIIEDDVYSAKLDTYINLFEYYDNTNYSLITGDIESKQASKDWNWWSDPDIISYNHQYRSYNPICRLSIKLINLILDFRKKYQQFCFHETLFASLCIENNLNFLDYNTDKNPYTGNIRYRPCYQTTEITDNKIYHPVKL